MPDHEDIGNVPPYMNNAPLDLPIPDYVSVCHAQEPHTLVDCREEWEWEIVRLPDAVLLPLGTLVDHMDSIPRDRLVVVYCHHGVRSRHAAKMLRAAGCNAVSLVGGIDLYARTIDMNLPVY